MSETDPPVLILAPTGRDAVVASAILSEGGLRAALCAGLPDLVARLDAGSCAVVTEEALRDADRRDLAAWIAGQEPWSDYPFLLLTLRGSPPDPRLMEILGNVTLLERPFHPTTLLTAARFAVRARRRQREAAAFLRERQQTAERQTLLIRELHHRVKNTLATVQALLGASSRSATSVDEFYQSFSARVISLAKTHNLLTDDYWQMASLQEMLENELAPYNDAEGRRIALDGPPVELTADLAVPTGMAIHELTTNAAKHGALSVPEGRIAVRWEIRAAEGARRLRLDWTERGGPPARPPTRKGFGSTLLQRVLTMQCGADIRFDFAPAGLHFRMEAPLVETRTVPHY
ncbi:signal transduction histidine kinase [Methylobacterium sp. 4-46]|uniref:sensor histidine kinase n=1 Tax=unclassified Methylobacterium TaxID=2615210 RepID=UPI000152CE9E|nr:MULTISPECIES: sensor histidine kinase [Methylobacterium]ACA20203.1 signal transduction histidine kinase [Methylobacterium sp. 4-46]WFT79383.1 sensor histidine kinase [Methylobacterium nodulans]